MAAAEHREPCDSRDAAIRLALISKVLVMTGGPGVGKTTIVRGILRILAAKGTNLLLCAPTGRAAKRMTEATGFEAKTIHRLLEVDPKGGGFKRSDDNPLDCTNQPPGFFRGAEGARWALHRPVTRAFLYLLPGRSRALER
jgi:ATP-dependent exoDNAse (exonuclease V) alpha subunit